MTPLTMTEKILARAAGRDRVQPGDNIWVNVDVLMTHDVCGPGTIGIFKQHFGPKARVWDPDKVVIIPDHYIFTADRMANRNVEVLRVFAAEQGLRYYVNSLFATPMVAVLPLVSLWFGYSAEARLATVVFASFFSIVINVCDGARSVPLDYLEVARSFRARPVATLFDVLLPSSLPYLLAGVRLAAGRALIGAVVAEFFISIPGLGFYVLYNSRIFKHNEAMVAVIVLVAAGVGFDALVKWLTRRFMPWARRA